MKSPDQIKKDLSAPIHVHYHADFEPRLTKRTMYDLEAMHANAIALIQQLQDDLQLEKKRTDALATGLAVLKNAKKQLEDHLREATKKVKQLEAERDAMKEALGLMVYQYCVSGTELDHRYMCAGETAFRVLGLEQYGDTRTLESWLFPEPPET